MIVVVQGGHESEGEISRMTSKAFQRALDKLNLTYHVLEFDSDCVENLKKLKPSVCLNALHGSMGEDGVFQSICEFLKVPYTGSGVLASSLCFNKVKSLELAQMYGVATLPSFSVTSVEQAMESVSAIKFWGEGGYVVKPSQSGSSRGVSLCTGLDQLKAALVEAFKWDKTAIIEKRFYGRELTVSVYQGKALVPIEIKPKDGFYDMKNKYTVGATEYLVPAPVRAETCEKMQKWSELLYQKFDIKTYCRVDFLVNESEVGSDIQSEIIFMEVNTLPGCTETSLFPKAAKHNGYAFETIVETLIKDAKDL